MSAAHLQNYHSACNHNERVKNLIRKFDIKLQKAHGERQELLDLENPGDGRPPQKLCFADDARCSDLYLQIQDISRTLEQLNSLILPEEL